MPAPLEWQQTAPAHHPCYPHHFAGNALVPGALLLEWIDRELSARHGLRISAIKQIKFLQPLRPAEIFLTAFSPNARGYALSLTRAGEAILSGQVSLIAASGESPA